MVTSLGLTWVNYDRVYCYRSNNSRARAYARIWGFNKVWQLALGEDPAYVIEVLSEKFDHLPQKRRDEILLHEIAHIPKNFSGALLPHTRRGKGSFHDKLKTMLSLYAKLV